MFHIQRITIIGIVTLVIVVLGAWDSVGHAAETTIAERYAGSFVVTQTSAGEQYWYIDPATLTRVRVGKGNLWGQFLASFGQQGSTSALKVLEPGKTSSSIDTVTTQKYRGMILKASDAGRFWYINPLDERRYTLVDGIEGFTVVRDIALDISAERLEQLKLSTALGSDYPDQTQLVPITDEVVDRQLYNSVFNILRSDHLYQTKFNDRELFYGSLKGMAAVAGDEFTEFFPPDQNKALQQRLSSDASIEGIGAVVQVRDKVPYIVSTLKGSPAEIAGVLPKDQILAIDDKATTGLSVEQIVERIKGPAGTVVVLRLYRASSGVTSDFRITRERIDIPTVTAELLDNKYAYFSFSVFSADVADEFRKLLQTTVTPQTRGLIIDMRNNPGGYTSSAYQLADMWLSRGEQIYGEKRLGFETKYFASSGKEVPSLPTIILVNNETASAAEIFSGSLMHHQQATLVGERTFGKGTGQNLINFTDGSGLKYTVFEWVLPGGVEVNHVGIIPQYVVPAGQGSPIDVQLEYAKGLIP